MLTYSIFGHLSVRPGFANIIVPNNRTDIRLQGCSVEMPNILGVRMLVD